MTSTVRMGEDLPETTAAHPASAAVVHVLIVDDEALLADELAIGLGEAGFEVKTSESAAEARRVLAESPEISVVVSDVRMPGESGLSLVSSLLSERAGLDGIETVVMTGHATVEDAAAAVRAGAFDFLRKPFILDDMVAVVQAAGERARVKRDHARQQAEDARRLLDAEAERESMLRTDALTGLANRNGFAEALSHQLRADRTTAIVRLQILGLDGLREANGPTAAEAVQVDAAARLKAALGSGWLLARTGEDEFSAVAVEGVDEPEALAAASQMRGAVELAGAGSAARVALEAVAGVAHGSTARGLALDAAAGIAIASARREGGSRCVLFMPGMQDAAARRFAIAKRVPDAIARGGFALHYQPVVNVADRRLLGFEALLRWMHPELGSVSPAEFIPLAEEGPAILELGAWVVAEAARQARCWRGAVERGLYIAVNVSGRQIMHADVPGLFEAVLRLHNLPPTALVAEVTETVATGPGAKAAVGALGRLGVRVVLDDFGAGFSSLTTLRTLPVRTAKLDRGLVDQIGTDRRARDFCGGLVTAIHALGIGIVAEGVETEMQLAALRDMGCEAAQGWLFGRQVPAEEATRLIETDFLASAVA